MRSRRIFIEFVTTLMPILNSFMKHCNQILDTCALYNHKVLNKESIFGVPSSMKNSRSRVQ